MNGASTPMSVRSSGYPNVNSASTSTHILAASPGHTYNVNSSALTPQSAMSPEYTNMSSASTHVLALSPGHPHSASTSTLRSPDSASVFIDSPPPLQPEGQVFYDSAVKLTQQRLSNISNSNQPQPLSEHLTQFNQVPNHRTKFPCQNFPQNHHGENRASPPNNDQWRPASQTPARSQVMIGGQKQSPDPTLTLRQQINGSCANVAPWLRNENLYDPDNFESIPESATGMLRQNRRLNEPQIGQVGQGQTAAQLPVMEERKTNQIARWITDNTHHQPNLDEGITDHGVNSLVAMPDPLEQLPLGVPLDKVTVGISGFDDIFVPNHQTHSDERGKQDLVQDSPMSLSSSSVAKTGGYQGNRSSIASNQSKDRKIEAIKQYLAKPSSTNNLDPELLSKYFQDSNCQSVNSEEILSLLAGGQNPDNKEKSQTNKLPDGLDLNDYITPSMLQSLEEEKRQTETERYDDQNCVNVLSWLNRDDNNFLADLPSLPFAGKDTPSVTVSNHLNNPITAAARSRANNATLPQSNPPGINSFLPSSQQNGNVYTAPGYQNQSQITVDQRKRKPPAPSARSNTLQDMTRQTANIEHSRTPQHGAVSHNICSQNVKPSERKTHQPTDSFTTQQNILSGTLGVMQSAVPSRNVRVTGNIGMHNNVAVNHGMQNNVAVNNGMQNNVNNMSRNAVAIQQRKSSNNLLNKEYIMTNTTQAGNTCLSASYLPFQGDQLPNQSATISTSNGLGSNIHLNLSNAQLLPEEIQLLLSQPHPGSSPNVQVTTATVNNPDTLQTGSPQLQTAPPTQQTLQMINGTGLDPSQIEKYNTLRLQHANRTLTSSRFTANTRAGQAAMSNTGFIPETRQTHQQTFASNIQVGGASAAANQSDGGKFKVPSSDIRPSFSTANRSQEENFAQRQTYQSVGPSSDVSMYSTHSRDNRSIPMSNTSDMSISLTSDPSHDKTQQTTTLPNTSLSGVLLPNTSLPNASLQIGRDSHQLQPSTPSQQRCSNGNVSLQIGRDSHLLQPSTSHQRSSNGQIQMFGDHVQNTAVEIVGIDPQMQEKILSQHQMLPQNSGLASSNQRFVHPHQELPPQKSFPPELSSSQRTNNSPLPHPGAHRQTPVRHGSGISAQTSAENPGGMLQLDPPGLGESFVSGNPYFDFGAGFQGSGPHNYLDQNGVVPGYRQHDPDIGGLERFFGEDPFEFGGVLQARGLGDASRRAAEGKLSSDGDAGKGNHPTRSSCNGRNRPGVKKSVVDENDREMTERKPQQMSKVVGQVEETVDLTGDSMGSSLGEMRFDPDDDGET